MKYRTAENVKQQHSIKMVSSHHLSIGEASGEKSATWINQWYEPPNLNMETRTDSFKQCWNECEEYWEVKAMKYREGYDEEPYNIVKGMVNNPTTYLR